MIKIFYDDLGRILLIQIQIGIDLLQVPYNLETKIIDWELIIDSSLRDTIRSAWEDWARDKDLNHELRDRPDLATPAQPETKPQPNWTGFNTAMMLDSDYDYIQNATTNQTALRRLETLAINNSQNVTLIRAFWNQVVAGATVSVEAVERWNAIAQSANMPFSFDGDGKMQLGGV